MFLTIHSKVSLKKTFPAPLFFKLHRNLSSLARFSAFSSPSLGVYKTLFALSLCFCLGACGGGSSSSPSSNNSDSAEETPSPDPKECEVENGKGQQNWDASSGNWNDECELIACNAGHDNQESNNVCAENSSRTLFTGQQQKENGL